MEAALFKVFNFFATNKWAQWALLILLVIGTAGLYLAARDGRIRKQVKQEQAVETARERERVLETSRKEIENVEDAKDAAIAAPDSLPEFTNSDELRNEAPAIAEVILRRGRGDQ